MAGIEGSYLVLLLATWLIPPDIYAHCYKFQNTVGNKYIYKNKK